MRRTIALLAVAGLAALALATVAAPAWRLSYNPSSSAPRGWYTLAPVGRVTVGERVLAWPPAWAAKLADARAYVPRTVPLLKRVAAIGGSRVCRHGPALTINGRLAALALVADRSGRGLPVWHGCRRLAATDLLLLAGDRADSFDGRYFGPIGRSAVIARAIPLWTW